MKVGQIKAFAILIEVALITKVEEEEGHSRSPLAT
jgi:hypothetical protein